MTDAKHLLEFLECRVRLSLNLGLKFLGIQLAPVAPTGFRGKVALLSGLQVPVNRTPRQAEASGRFDFGATRLDEFEHAFSQIQRIGFHARKPTILCPNINMKCYIPAENHSHSHELAAARPVRCNTVPPPIIAIQLIGLFSELPDV